MPWTLPGPFREELIQLSGEVNWRGDWRLLGHIRLLEGHAGAAVEAYLRSRPGMLLRETLVTEHWKDLLAAKKAADGHPFGEKALLEWFRYGAYGPDGVAGTQDDLNDPLASLVAEEKAKGNATGIQTE